MSEFTSKQLSPQTWPEFARLVEKHNGIFGGCWCMAFHEEGVGNHKTPQQNRAEKDLRVKEGRAHAGLVFDGDKAVGWCQFGPTDELPRIKHKREYLKTAESLPDWRITCFFVDKTYRKQGVATLALNGALEEIARLGGGIVESYPMEVGDEKTSAIFLHSGTLSLFEQQGFQRDRRLGKKPLGCEKIIAGR